MNSEVENMNNCACGESCSCMNEMNNDVECACGESCECNHEGHECTCGETCECTEEHNCGCMEKEDKKMKKNKLKEENKILKDTIKRLEQDVLVAKADLINYRKRKDEEISRMLKFCNEDLVKALLPTIDNFERAIKMDDDNLEDEVSKFLEGFKMVYCGFNEVLKNHDVKPIDQNNVEFDPNYHNAIMVEPREGVKPGVVIEVLQKGYILKDKVIRPAMVKVSE